MQRDKAGSRFSTVIVNYNGSNALLEAVQSVLREGVPVSQIVVVDNGSSDDSIAQLELGVPGTCILRNVCNTGFARAVNRGMHGLSSEFILLLNNDAQLVPGALSAFAEAFDAMPKLAIAGGQLRYPDGRLQSAFAPLPTLMTELIPTNFLKWTRPDVYVRSTSSTDTREVESVFGACFAVRTSVLPDMGLLDEDFFFYFEEVDWCRRAHLIGLSVCYVPSACAIHWLGYTANRSRGDARIELQRSKLIYFRKSSPAWTYQILSIFLVFRALVNAVFGSVAYLLTLGLQHKLRRSTSVYWRIFSWHAAGRPAAWGLPGKCTPTSISRN